MNTFAESNVDIVEGLQKSSAAMAAMGSSFDSTLSLFTAGQEIIQDASLMGNALRSISMRVRQYDEETEELSEDLVNITGDVVELTKVASNNYQGVSLFTDASQTEYRQLIDYLGDIADIYDEIEAKPRQELLEKLFGKNRAQAGAAILTNFDAAREAMETLTDSAGSAEQELKVVTDSISYKINQFKETFTGLSQDTFTQDFLKSMVDSGTRLLETFSDASPVLGDFLNIISNIVTTVTELTKQIGLIPAVLGAVSLKKLGLFSANIRNDFIQYGQSLSALKTIVGSTATQTEALAFAVQNLTPKQQAYALAVRGVTQEETARVLALNQVEEKEIQQILLDTAITQKKKELTQATAIEAITAQGLNKETALSIMRSAGIVASDNAQVISKKQVNVATLEAKLAQKGLSAAQINAITTELGLSTSTLTLSNYFKGLGVSIANTTKGLTAFMLTNPLGWITLIASAIMGVKTLIDKFNQEQEEARQTAVDSAKAINEYSESLNGLIDEYTTIIDSEKTDAEKTEELNQWKQTLAETYDFERDNLKKLNLERENGIELLKQEIDANNQYQRDKWKKDNADQINQAIGEIYYPEEYQQSLKEFYERYYDAVSAPIKQAMDRNNTSVSNAFEDLDQQKELYSELVKLKERAEISEYDNIIFTETDQQLLDEVSKQIDILETSIEKYGDIYKQYFSGEAISFLDFYKETNSAEDFKTFSEEGKQAYISWRNGLLKEAERTKYGSEVQDGLKQILQSDYSEYEDYFERLQTAKDKFLPHISLDSQAGVDARNRIKKFIDSLSSEELTILLELDDNAFNKGISGVKKAIADIQTDPNFVIQVDVSIDEEKLDDLRDSIKEITDSQKDFNSALEEQKEHGQLSTSTIQSLAKAGYAEALVIDKATGAVTLNTTAYEKLINKKKKEIQLAITRLKVDLINPYKDETAAIADLKRSLEKLNPVEREAVRIKIANMEASLANSKLTDKQAKEKEQELANLKAMLASIDAPDFEKSGGSSGDGDNDKPLSIQKFEKEQAAKQHALKMGQISEAEYYSWLKTASVEAYKGLAEYQNDYQKHQEDIYDWEKKQEQDIFDTRMDNLEKEKDKALKNNDFDTAKASVNTQITETQKRIVELETSGKKDVDDEIKELNDDLADLTETLNDINSDEYEFNVSVKEDSIDELNKKLEKTGDTSVYDQQIGIYTDLISDAQNEISRLLDLGYSKDSDEIRKLVDEIDGYYEDINDIYEKQTDAIKSNVDEQITALDRKIENTGDTNVYSEKIKAYEDAQQQILDRIKFYREQGYAEDSEIIKGLKEQWNDYTDNINDTRKEQADAQVEAYNEILDKQKEVLEKQKKEQDEIYDNEIKLLKNKKTALEQVNKEIEKENELEEKRQALAEAERNMYKNVRLTYAGNGQWVQKARDEDLKAVKDAEKDLSETAAEQIKEKEIEAIEKQITALEESKDAFDDSIEKQITAIEDSEKAFEEAMKESYEVRKQLDKAFISSVVGEDKANEYLSEAGNLTANTETPQTENKAVQTNNKAAKTDNSIPLRSPLHKTSYDDAFRSIYDLLNKKGALLSGATFDKFLNNINIGLLPSMQNITPKIADDTVTGDAADNITFNNKPVITNNITVTGNNKSDKELANTIAETCETKISQAFTAFGNTFTNGLKKKLYGNT